MALPKQHSVRQETREPLRWRQLMLSLLLIFISAFCLLKYLGWAWVFSGNFGLPSQARTVLLARQWSLTYFVAGLLAEGALITNLTINIRFENAGLTGVPKPVARILTALAIAVVGTLGVAFLLSWFGRMLR